MSWWPPWRLGEFCSATASDATAQAVVTYYPSAPVVGYAPEVRGLFGRRLVYRPVVAAPVATYYAPAPAAVTSYYAPAPMMSYYAPPVAAPAAVTSYYAPAVAAPVAVTSYYAPAAPLVYPGRVVTYRVPARVMVPPVVTYYPSLLVP